MIILFDPHIAMISNRLIERSFNFQGNLDDEEKGKVEEVE